MFVNIIYFFKRQIHFCLFLYCFSTTLFLLIFVISFFMLTLVFIYSFYSSSMRCKVRLFEISLFLNIGVYHYRWAFQVVQWVKNLPAVQEMPEMWVRFLGWEDPLEGGVAAHSSILAWRIPWTDEPGGLQSMGSQRVRHD